MSGIRQSAKMPEYVLQSSHESSVQWWEISREGGVCVVATKA